MSLSKGEIPEWLKDIWNNLSPQMQGRIKVFGLEPSPLNSSDFTRKQWDNLSPQMRGRIKSRKSMEEERIKLEKKLGLKK